MAGSSNTPAAGVRKQPAENIELQGARQVIDNTGSNRDATGRQPHSNSFPNGTPFPQLLTAGYAFFCAGINDGSLGPLIPYLLRSYNVQTNFVSILFGVTFFGWFFAALTNSHLMATLDFGLILVLGASFQLLAQVLRFWLPPFGLFATTFFFVSLGQAYQDAHMNTYVTSVTDIPTHRWLGFIHAMYALGCFVGPFVSTAVAAADTPSRWNLFYCFPLGLSTINLILTVWSFRTNCRLKKLQHPGVLSEDLIENQPQRPGGVGNRNAMKQIKDTLRIPAVWLMSLYFFFFLGAAITASGWIVTYLVDVRGGKISSMGYVSGGYSGGVFLGRLLLAEPTYRFGERRMIMVYIILCLAMQLCFWLVPNIIAGSVTVCLLGFFSGPFFATGVSVANRLFPQHIKASALAQIFVLGQVGGSVFPAFTGIIAVRAGVSALQPILVGLIVATGASWLILPKDMKEE